MSGGDGQYICAWCGQLFAKAHPLGAPPKYCKRSHRQMAYQKRREDRLVAEALAAVKHHG